MPERKRLRLAGYDYARNGAYFVTICVNEHIECFGEIRNGEKVLNQCGIIVQSQWEWLFRQYHHIVRDEYIIMPNHVHAIIWIKAGDGRGTGDHLNSGGIDFNDDVNDDCGVYVGIDGDVGVGNGRDRSLRDHHDHHDHRDHNGYHDCDTHDAHNNRPNRNEPICHQNPKPTVKPLPQIIGAFKTTASKMIHNAGLSVFRWQKSYHDRIVRNEEELNRIRYYIMNNPASWKTDRNQPVDNFYPEVDHA